MADQDCRQPSSFEQPKFAHVLLDQISKTRLSGLRHLKLLPFCRRRAGELGRCGWAWNNTSHEITRYCSGRLSEYFTDAGRT